MFNLLLWFLISGNPFTKGADIPSDESIVIRYAARCRGAILVHFIRPGMSENQVHRILGQPTSISMSSAGMTQSYWGMGIELVWSLPLWMIAPGERLGPEVMGALRAIPSMWVQLTVVPFLSADYCEPSVVTEVRWMGFGGS